MNITLFVGSGISLESGVPSVSEVTQLLFDQTYQELADQFFEHWDEDKGGKLDEWRSAKPIQDYLELLTEEHETYIKDRLGDHHQTSYEDLYSILDQIEREEITVSDNYVMTDFVERHRDSSEEFRTRHSNFQKPTKFGKFSERCKHFIEDVIRHYVEADQIEGLGVLEDLFQDEKVSSVEIFSLNHDNLIEKLCKREEVPIIDGFQEPDGEIRFADSNLYDQVSKIKLYKLHGGTDWYWVINRDTGEQGYAIFSGSDIWNIKTDSGRNAEMLIDDSNFLTGINKLLHYNDGFFGELQYRFTTALKETDYLIMSGYGWNDLPLNRKILDWLKNENSKLLIFHKDPDSLINNSRYLTNYTARPLRDSGKMIFIEKWFQEARIDEVLDFIGI